MPGPQPQNTPPWGNETRPALVNPQQAKPKGKPTEEWELIRAMSSTDLELDNVSEPSTTELGDWTSSRKCVNITGPALQTDLGLSTTFL